MVALAFDCSRSTAMVLLILACIPLQSVDAADAETKTYVAKFLQACDGDTILVETTDGKKLLVDLWGIDAPQLHQPGGKAAQRHLQDLVESSRDLTFPYHLLIESRGAAGASRLIGSVQVAIGHSFPGLQKAYGEELRYQLVRNGWAQHDDKEAPQDEKLRKLAETARRERRGIWKSSGNSAERHCASRQPAGR